LDTGQNNLPTIATVSPHAASNRFSWLLKKSYREIGDHQWKVLAPHRKGYPAPYSRVGLLRPRLFLKPMKTWMYFFTVLPRKAGNGANLKLVLPLAIEFNTCLSLLIEIGLLAIKVDFRGRRDSPFNQPFRSTDLNTFLPKLGGHFGAKKGGHFHAESGGHFETKNSGHIRRNLQYDTVIRKSF